MGLSKGFIRSDKCSDPAKGIKVHFAEKQTAFIETCKRVLLPSAQPVGVIVDESKGPFVKCAGSTLLLECDGGSLFITNDHVAEELLRRDKLCPGCRLASLDLIQQTDLSSEMQALMLRVLA